MAMVCGELGSAVAAYARWSSYGLILTYPSARARLAESSARASICDGAGGLARGDASALVHRARRSAARNIDRGLELPRVVAGPPGCQLRCSVTALAGGAAIRVEAGDGRARLTGHT